MKTQVSLLSELPDRQASEVAIDIRQVRKTFESARGPVDAIGLATFSVGAGEFVSILGPSGCGKSTLLMTVAGLERPTSGEVRLFGRRVDAPSQKVGMIFQDSTLLPWKSILDNVVFPARVKRVTLAPYLDRAHQLLDAVGLHGFAHKRPAELSGGMRQRAAICRALIDDPAVLLMDEPFSALDAITRDEMNELLLRLWQQVSKAALFVTHSIPEAIFLSDRIIVMGARPSRIVADIRVPFGRPRSTEVQAESRFMALAAELKALIHPAERKSERVVLPPALRSTGRDGEGVLA